MRLTNNNFGAAIPSVKLITSSRTAIILIPPNSISGYDLLRHRKVLEHTILNCTLNHLLGVVPLAANSSTGIFRLIPVMASSDSCSHCSDDRRHLLSSLDKFPLLPVCCHPYQPLSGIFTSNILIPSSPSPVHSRLKLILHPRLP
jgi:hypothetical protein